MNSDDERRAARARQLFERAVERAPVATANRLRIARRAALAGRASPGLGSALRWSVPLGATAALLLGLGWWRQGQVPTTTGPVAAAAATSAAAVENPAIAGLPGEDEADLYAWLADAPVASDATMDGGRL